MLLEKGLFNNQGYVKLLDVIPSVIPEGYSSRDAVIANTARLSTMGKPLENNIKVYDFLEKLFSWKHFSPFEQAQLSFEIKVPLVNFWQMDRHRTFLYGSHLRRSGRYTEFLEEDFYIPDYNTGSDTFQEDLKYHIQDSIVKYKEAINKGVKKETARFLLPAWCMMYTEVMSVDLKNLMHFFGLRLNRHAQKEIRELATQMFALTSTVFPYTCKIFRENLEPINYDLRSD